MLESSKEFIKYCWSFFEKYFKDGKFDVALEYAIHMLDIIRNDDGEYSEPYVDYSLLLVDVYEAKKDYYKALEETIKIKEIQKNLRN